MRVSFDLYHARVLDGDTFELHLIRIHLALLLLLRFLLRLERTTTNIGSLATPPRTVFGKHDGI
jgi:hypothetical protein